MKIQGNYMIDELRDFLENDEEILWQHIGRTKNVLKEKASKAPSIFIILVIIFFIIGGYYFLLYIVAIIFCCLTFHSVGSGDWYEKYQKRQEKERFFTRSLNLNYRELKNFREFCVLTNKRWIQREGNRDFYKYASKFPETIEKGKWGVSIKFQDIKIWNLRKDSRFYLNLEEYKKRRESLFGISFRDNKLQEILSESNFYYSEVGENDQEIYYQKEIKLEPQYVVRENKEKCDIKSLGSVQK